MISSILQSWQQTPFLVPTPSFNLPSLVGDRNAIMIAARISGYGSEYKTSLSCPSCSAKQEYCFNLHDYEVNTLEEMPDVFGLQDLGGGLFITTLPRTNC